ncbi:hypothetical protein MKW94_001847 [Papaver nudicaule]|uniref:Cysteine-rich receptor-like protein kinase 2 n=1 Tax=Papaver nudicaule TaxID=74823 RepID=A0AA41VV61_PAPNU|nr:hypothetical protein [Papaver nudicaule]
MAEHHHSFMFFLCLLSAIRLAAVAQEHEEPLKKGDGHFVLLTKVCEKKKFENVTNFVVNYNEANSILIRENFFALKAGQTSTGKTPYKIYLMAACYEDLSMDQCHNCYIQSRYHLPTCFPWAGGLVHLGGCFLRAANYNFFHEFSSPTMDEKICGPTTMKNYDESHRESIRRMVYGTVKNAIGIGAADTFPALFGSAPLYVQANCWKTLDRFSCAACLDESASAVVSCLPATEAWSLKAGCVIHYSDYPFFEEGKSSNIRSTAITFVGYVLGATMLCVLAICTGILAGKVTYDRRNRQLAATIAGADGDLFKRVLKFKYATLEKATHHFSEANKLGQGGFGEVFKGTLADGREIAVKRLYANPTSQSEEIFNEMNVISHCHHKNLVRFLGCSITTLDSILVYEFVPNKSLNLFLFDSEKKKELDWKKRLGIIKGTADGLAYLHEDCQIVIVHRDIKASNILLDLRFRPKIADFGLARICADHAKGDPKGGIVIAGTFGYMSPEYLTHGQLTEKVDVYSYGVIVLEIVTGIQSNHFTSDESLETLVTWTWKHYKSSKVSDIIDESIKDQVDEEELKRVVQVGLLCTQEAAALRPTMQEVIQMLRRNDQQLPEPSKPPFFDDTLGSAKNHKFLYGSSRGDSQRHQNVPDFCKSHHISSTKHRL